MIKVQTTQELPRADEATAVDAEIRDFGEWFQTLGNDPLVSGERAILKTFLYWALQVKGKVDGT